MDEDQDLSEYVKKKPFINIFMWKTKQDILETQNSTDVSSVTSWNKEMEISQFLKYDVRYWITVLYN